MRKKTVPSDVALNGSAKRAIIYARVSLKEQEREDYSIPAQLKLLKDYADAENIRIVEEYVDVETANH
jgi:DNA invertase Pin-like site-specific DNA recombinase